MNKRTSFLAAVASLLIISTTVYAEEAKPAMPADTSVPPATTPNEPVQAASSVQVEVLRAVLTNTLQDREPSAEVTTAAVGDTVIGWTQMKAEGGEGAITHRWLHEGNNMGDVGLPVRSASWRTWSRKTVSQSGHWKWQVLDASGATLKEVAFTVTEAAAAPTAPAASGQ